MTDASGALGPGEGDRLRLGSIPLTFKVHSRWTGGGYCVAEQPIAPGLLVPPHRHTHEDQWSYVLAGTLGFKVGDEEFEVPAGGCVFRPRGVPHALWNAGTEPARMLEVSSPGGIEDYFLLFDALPESSEVREVRKLGERHGISYVDDWVPYLADKYCVSTSGGFWTT